MKYQAENWKKKLSINKKSPQNCKNLVENPIWTVVWEVINEDYLVSLDIISEGKGFI